MNLILSSLDAFARELLNIVTTVAQYHVAIDYNMICLLFMLRLFVFCYICSRRVVLLYSSFACSVQMRNFAWHCFFNKLILLVR